MSRQSKSVSVHASGNDVESRAAAACISKARQDLTGGCSNQNWIFSLEKKQQESRRTPSLTYDEHVSPLSSPAKHLSLRPHEQQQQQQSSGSGSRGRDKRICRLTCHRKREFNFERERGRREGALTLLRRRSQTENTVEVEVGRRCTRSPTPDSHVYSETRGTSDAPIMR